MGASSDISPKADNPARLVALLGGCLIGIELLLADSRGGGQRASPSAHEDRPRFLHATSQPVPGRAGGSAPLPTVRAGRNWLRVGAGGSGLETANANTPLVHWPPILLGQQEWDGGLVTAGWASQEHDARGNGQVP